MGEIKEAKSDNIAKDDFNSLVEALLVRLQENGNIKPDLLFADRGDPNGYDFETGSFTTNGAWQPLDLSSIIPIGTKAVLIRVLLQDDAAISIIRFSNPDFTFRFNAAYISTQVANVFISSDLIVIPNANRLLTYLATNTTFTSIRLIVRGWWI